MVTRSGTKPNFPWSSFSGAEAPNVLTPIIAQVVRGQVFEFMGILPLRHLLRTTFTPLDRVAPQIFAFWFEAPLINFFEPETWLGSYHFAFDRKSKLWKIFEWRWKYSETFKDWAKINHGAQAYTWQSVSVIDIQNQRATIIRGFGDGFPNYPISEATSTFDVNRLEQVHR